MVPLQWGGGRLFGALAVFFVEMAATLNQKIEKLIPKLLINRLSEGYERAIGKIWCLKFEFWAEIW